MRVQDMIVGDQQGTSTMVVLPPDGEESGPPPAVPTTNTSPVTITSEDTAGGTAGGTAGSDKSCGGSPASASALRYDSRVSLNLSPSGGFLSPLECSTPLGASGGSRTYCV
nr:uncharacterized protein LOC128699476 [Cherax quadricarinatus]